MLDGSTTVLSAGETPAKGHHTHSIISSRVQGLHRYRCERTYGNHDVISQRPGPPAQVK